MRILLVIWFLWMAVPALAGTVIAATPVRANTLLGPEHLAVIRKTIPGAISEAETAIGMEARVNLYPGRPVYPGDIGPPAIVERNQIVVMRYAFGGLSIYAEGRSLSRAGVGEIVRVMNIDSRNIVNGTVLESGEILVGGRP